MARALVFAALAALAVANIHAAPQGRLGLGLGRNQQAQQQQQQPAGRQGLLGQGNGRQGLLGLGRNNNNQHLGHVDGQLDAHVDGQQSHLGRLLPGRRQQNHDPRNVDFQLGNLHVQADLNRPGQLGGQIREDVHERVRSGNTLHGRVADLNAGLVLGVADGTAGMIHRANDRQRGRLGLGAGIVDGMAARGRQQGDRSMARVQGGAALARNAVNGVAGMIEAGVNARNNMRNRILGGVARAVDRNTARRIGGLDRMDGAVNAIDGAVHGAVGLGVANSRRGGVLTNPLTTMGAVGRAMRPSGSAGLNLNGPLGNVRLGVNQQ